MCKAVVIFFEVDLLTSVSTSTYNREIGINKSVTVVANFNMSLSVFISKEQKLFLFDSFTCPKLKDEVCLRHKLDYGFVLCRAIIEFMKKNEQLDKNLIEEKMRSLLSSLQTGEEFQDKNFVEIVKFTNSNKGYVFIDHTDGIQPFILYKQDNAEYYPSELNEANVEDFKESVENLLSSIDKEDSKLWNLLYTYALSNRSWNREIKNIAWQELNKASKSSAKLCAL
ncbi:MAG: hypothetical protein QNJ31_01375 [Candidatus Caenarcaniphilales bacterium]|nr:hypothetical protein [Candidatus Caenarcaniphilales bacterium]